MAFSRLTYPADNIATLFGDQEDVSISRMMLARSTLLPALLADKADDQDLHEEEIPDEDQPVSTGRFLNGTGKAFLQKYAETYRGTDAGNHDTLLNYVLAQDDREDKPEIPPEEVSIREVSLSGLVVQDDGDADADVPALVMETAFVETVEDIALDAKAVIIPPLKEASHDLLFCDVARRELLEVATCLTMLCQSAIQDAQRHALNPETLFFLLQRLDSVAELLGVLDQQEAIEEEEKGGVLLSLVQDAISARAQDAAKRQIVLGLEIAGGVREHASGLFASLIPAMLSCAIHGVAYSGRIDIVTRREGRLAAVSMILSSGGAIRRQGQAAEDLAVLQNMVTRQGGRLSVVNKGALCQQWTLRMPLAADDTGQIKEIFTSRPPDSSGFV